MLLVVRSSIPMLEAVECISVRDPIPCPRRKSSNSDALENRASGFFASSTINPSMLVGFESGGT